MSEFRILDTNYFFENAVSITASSSDTEFPISNLDKFNLSKVWRSNSTGNFVIDATNNKIDFEEVAATEITSTLTSATYTSATLATEIKTQMDADGANNYTVSQNASTGKWTITSDGGFLSLLNLTGTNNATSALDSIGFASSDHTGATTYTGASIAIHTEEFVTIDLSTTEEIDSFAVIFNKQDGVKFSSSAVLTLMANATLDFSSPAVSQVVSVDTLRDVVTHFFTSDQSYRYWRLKIVDTANSNLYVEVPKLVLSGATTLSQTPQRGFNDKFVDRSNILTTPYGHEFNDTFPILRELSFSYELLPEADLDILEQIYRRVGSTTPICISLDPPGTNYDKDRFFIYGKFSSTLDNKHNVFTYFDTGFTVREVQ